MLISREYLALNRELHEKHLGYGLNAWHWVGPVLKFARTLEAKTILDYGAGKGSLASWMPEEFEVRNYDPVTFPAEPTPADMVVCLDVMEHIEPDYLSLVLKHIRSKSKKGAFFVISTRPASKLLADGRNAHLIVENADFWVRNLGQYYRKVKMVSVGRPDEVVLFARV